jgi:hypothetical protein
VSYLVGYDQGKKRDEKKIETNRSFLEGASVLAAPGESLGARAGGEGRLDRTQLEEEVDVD